MEEKENGGGENNQNRDLVNAEKAHKFSVFTVLKCVCTLNFFRQCAQEHTAVHINKMLKSEGLLLTGTVCRCRCIVESREESGLFS